MLMSFYLFVPRLHAPDPVLLCSLCCMFPMCYLCCACVVLMLCLHGGIAELSHCVVCLAFPVLLLDMGHCNIAPILWEACFSTVLSFGCVLDSWLNREFRNSFSAVQIGDCVSGCLVVVCGCNMVIESGKPWLVWRGCRKCIEWIFLRDMWAIVMERTAQNAQPQQ